MHHDPIPQVVANQRLHVIREIGQQRRRAEIPSRYDTPLCIDRLENHPITVHMQAALAAFEGDIQKLGSAVAVRHGASEGLLVDGITVGAQASTSAISADIGWRKEMPDRSECAAGLRRRSRSTETLLAK